MTFPVWAERLDHTIERRTGLRLRAFLRDLRRAAKTLVGSREEDRRLLLRLLNQREPTGVLADLLEQVPQAIMVDRSVAECEDRNWRDHFAARLRGHGLEIGPLHQPLSLPSGATVDYIDRHTLHELRREYPQLEDLPIVAPTIIGDAQTLHGVADQAYDFVVAAHVIEHMRDPIGALEQWCRVVRPGGLVYLIAPDKRATFDRARVRTPLEHLILDYRRPSSERDFEHFLDFAAKPGARYGAEAIDEADRLVATDYSIHFHVFMPADLVELVRWFCVHVRPVEIAEGPSMSPGADEFHLLLRTGSTA